MKIRLMGPELFHADRQRDGRAEMTKLTVALRNFANAPKTVPEILPCVADCRRRKKRHCYFLKRVRIVNVINFRLHNFVQARKMHLFKVLINTIFFLLSYKRKTKKYFLDPSGPADNILQTGQDQNYTMTLQLDTASSPTESTVLLSHSMHNLRR
jgi:hypothetical protein